MFSQVAKASSSALACKERMHHICLYGGRRRQPKWRMPFPLPSGAPLMFIPDMKILKVVELLEEND